MRRLQDGLEYLFCLYERADLSNDTKKKINILGQILEAFDDKRKELEESEKGVMNFFSIIEEEKPKTKNRGKMVDKDFKLTKVIEALNVGEKLRLIPYKNHLYEGRCPLCSNYYENLVVSNYHKKAYCFDCGFLYKVNKNEIETYDELRERQRNEANAKRNPLYFVIEEADRPD